MKKTRFKGVVLACLVSVALIAAPALAAQKVMVLTGINKEKADVVGTYQLVYDGITEALKAKGITPEFQWADLDSQPDDAGKAALGQEWAAKIKAAKPDVLISLNDTCLKFVATQLNDIPVVFAYVFSKDLKSFGLPKPNITGVTRRSYAPDIWGLAHKLTGAKTVALLSKHSIPMEGVRKYILAGADKLEKLSGVRVKEMHNVNTFEEWKNKVENWQEDLIYLADTSRIEKDGKIMDRKELVQWTVNNSNKPVIAASVADVEAGGLFSIVTSEDQMGNLAAELAIKILDGASPKDIPMQSNAKGKLVVNATTSQKLKVDFPYEILSTAEKIFE